MTRRVVEDSERLRTFLAQYCQSMCDGCMCVLPSGHGGFHRCDSDHTDVYSYIWTDEDAERFSREVTESPFETRVPTEQELADYYQSHKDDPEEWEDISDDEAYDRHVDQKVDEAKERHAETGSYFRHDD